MSDVRVQLIRRLNGLAERLPNGLLTRLVDDAQFFHDWNIRKKTARASARLRNYKPAVRSKSDDHQGGDAST